MKKLIEPLVYGALIAVSLIVLGLFSLLPRLSLVTAAVYQGF